MHSSNDTEYNTNSHAQDITILYPTAFVTGIHWLLVKTHMISSLRQHCQSHSCSLETTTVRTARCDPNLATTALSSRYTWQSEVDEQGQVMTVWIAQ
jgi:hypothetical protein